MKEDSTFLLSESTGWIVDWAHPAFEICRDKRRGSTYGKITYTVTKDPGHDWKAEVGDGKWHKHSNEVTVLKHMSAGVTMVCLEVHYESYVNKHGRQMQCPSGMGRAAIRTTSGTTSHSSCPAMG